MPNYNKIGSGPNVGVQQQVDPAFQADRASIRPLDHTQFGRILGHYRAAATFSNTAGGPAAGTALFAMRYTDGSSMAVIERITVGALITTAFTTAQALDVDAIAVRGFTAIDTGGTALTPSKMRAAMNASQVASGNLVIAPGAGLGAGTGTADASPFAELAIYQSASNALGAGSQGDLYKYDSLSEHPLVLAANEGFRVRNITALGAVGVVKFYMAVTWAEVAAY